MKDVLYEEINTLEDRVLKLLSDLKRLKSENVYLRDLLKKKEDVLKDFQNQSKIINIVEAKDKGIEIDDELRGRIDDSIRVIEKCIAHLSK